MSDLDLLYTDVEDDLRASVRDLLADRCEPTAVIAVYDGDRSLVDGLWKALAAEMGLAGLLVPEERGGAGASAREAAVVMEELGRTVAPVPFLTSAVIATTVLLDAGGRLTGAITSVAGALEADVLLVPAITGERVAVYAVPASAASIVPVISL